MGYVPGVLIFGQQDRYPSLEVPFESLRCTYSNIPDTHWGPSFVRIQAVCRDPSVESRDAVSRAKISCAFGEFVRVSCASRKADAPRRNRALIDPDLAFGRIAKGDTDRIWTSMMSNIVDCAITRLCDAQRSGMGGSMVGNVALHTSIPFRTTSLCCVMLKRV